MDVRKYTLWNNIRYVYGKVFRFNKKLIVQIPLEMVCELLVPIFAIAIPAMAVDLITNGKSIKEFLFVMGGITLLYMGILYAKQVLYQLIFVENTLARLREFFLQNAIKLMKTDYINVEPQDKQILIQKAINSFSSNWVGSEFLMKNTPVFIVNILGLIIYGSMITLLDLRIIVILILMTVLNFVLTYYARNYEEKHKSKYVKYDRQINYLYENSTSLVNGKDVRIYQMETWFYQVFKTLIKKRLQWQKRVEFRYFWPTLSDNILMFIRDIFAYGILVNKVLNMNMDAAAFTLYIGTIAGFSNWLTQTVTAYTNLSKANLGVNDYRAYEEIKEVYRHEEGCNLPKWDKSPLTIEFKDVSFRYPGASKDTISHINLRIEGGSKIALVGNNGAGKTTIVKLLSGLYYPTEGEILINGISITEFNIEDYHKIIGAVFQDAHTFSFTIAKIVASCKEGEIDYKKVRKCLSLAGLLDKIEKLEHKEKTYLTQQLCKEGIQLSGGEMQKLMLARALYKDAPIMILDEPTAALDPIAEGDLYEKYNDLTKNKTSIFISHRLSSTKFCDRILFLEHGQIVEDGTHADLMGKQGRYAEMYEIQSFYYRENLEVEKNEEWVF